MIGRMPQFVALRGAYMIPPPVDHLGSHSVDLMVRNNLPFTILRLVVAFPQWLLCCHRKHFLSILSNVFHPVLGGMLHKSLDQRWVDRSVDRAREYGQQHQLVHRESPPSRGWYRLAVRNTPV